MIGATRQREPVVLHRQGPRDAASRTLLLHGLANSASVWQRYLRTCPPDQEYVSADLPWSGERVGLLAGQAEPERWIDVALAGCASGAGTGPGDRGRSVDVLVAHSYAAVLTLLRLGQEPALIARYGIRALVLVAPFYRASTEDFVWADMTRSVDGFQALMDEGIRIHADGRVPATHRSELARRVRDRVGPYGWTDFFRSYLALPHVPLHALDLPCLVVTGADDIAAPPAEGALLARALPRATATELPGCGHFLMSERPEAFRDVIEHFTTPHLTTGASTR